jgi:hypothetical protein
MGGPLARRRPPLSSCFPQISPQTFHSHVADGFLPIPASLAGCFDAAAAPLLGVLVCKVRAHCGVRGNEAADALPRRVLCLPPGSICVCPYPAIFVYIPSPLCPLHSVSCLLRTGAHSGSWGTICKPAAAGKRCSHSGARTAHHRHSAQRPCQLRCVAFKMSQSVQADTDIAFALKARFNVYCGQQRLRLLG